MVLARIRITQSLNKGGTTKQQYSRYQLKSPPTPRLPLERSWRKLRQQHDAFCPRALLLPLLSERLAVVTCFPQLQQWVRLLAA